MSGNTLSAQPVLMPDGEPQLPSREVPTETAQDVGRVATGPQLYHVVANIYSPDGRHLIIL